MDNVDLAIFVFVYGPLALLGVALNVAGAIFVFLKDRAPERLLTLTTRTLIVFWTIGVLFAVTSRIGWRDWVHLYWSAQIPLIGVFLGSGVLLCRTWHEPSDPDRGKQVTCASTARNGAVLFFAMAVSLGLLPLLLQLSLPEDRPSPREIGAPIRGLVALASWGLGGVRPAALDPITSEEVARGVGHLPRDLTVPMGITLIAAWLWIAFSLLALAGRLIRSQSARLRFFLLGPLALGAVNFAFSDQSVRGFDPRIFSTDQDDGIWTSDPELLRSYGPVLLAAVACAFLIGTMLARQSGDRSR